MSRFFVISFFLFQHLRLPFVVLPIKGYHRHLLWPPVCLTMSVCSSVCLSQMGVLSKQLNVDHTKAPHNSPGTDENDIEAVKELRRWRWHTHTHTHHTHPFNGLCPGLLGWAGTRKAKPIWILLTQETMSGSGTSWAICKSAPRSRVQTDNHASTPPLSFYRPDALPAA